MNASSKREKLLRYFEVERDDLEREYEGRIAWRIRRASDESIKTDRPCEGKHWIEMDFKKRPVCPYCGWELRRENNAPELRAPRRTPVGRG